MELDLLSKNHFDLFGLPESFDLDGEELAERFRELQRVVHPDRFANASDTERRLSMQQATRINDAFQTLKDPLSRARYLLELRGVPVDDSDTRMDPGFLMEQMDLRERLAEVDALEHPGPTLDALRREIKGREAHLLATLRLLLGRPANLPAEEARARVREYQFLRRLGEELTDLEERLFNEP